MKPPFVRNPYNYDTNQAGDDSGLKCLDKTRTQQSFAEEVDINTIVRRFNLTGEIPAGIRMPEYGDYTGISDFKTAMDALAIANEAFDAMPASVRSRFHNSPAEFVDFCLDDANREEAEKLGLVPKKTLVAPQPAPEPKPGATTPAPDPKTVT